jgi:hypothetical protein
MAHESPAASVPLRKGMPAQEASPARIAAQRAAVRPHAHRRGGASRARRLVTGRPRRGWPRPALGGGVPLRSRSAGGRRQPAGRSRRPPEEFEDPSQPRAAILHELGLHSAGSRTSSRRRSRAASPPEARASSRMTATPAGTESLRSIGQQAVRREKLQSYPACPILYIIPLPARAVERQRERVSEGSSPREAMRVEAEGLSTGDNAGRRCSPVKREAATASSISGTRELRLAAHPYSPLCQAARHPAAGAAELALRGHEKILEGSPEGAVSAVTWLKREVG